MRTRMYKLLIHFHHPPDVTAFETHWSEQFVPLVEKMPGIRRVAVSRVYGGPGEETDLHLVHEFFFSSKDALRQAMISPEGQAAGEALMTFAAGYVSLNFAEHLEESRSEP